ncbi:glycosyltransferase family A protein [Reinekea sp.]|uniref:glycosyltransferase family 2 protein n=1 Tax=Reinekea sp. TaxID=1970455 RepID=UPI00257D9B5D|nr:glycosyltransferase family A protein [Reinekea sp.]MDO7642599.1 glycosyltransferase [Reinekea forsetii]
MTISKPVFSVVMPMYNVEKYIHQAISSVLAQSYQHFELLCIDDGSSDGTLAIAQSFSDHRIRIVQQKNRGLSGARNTGINHASGLYVAFLDSDDYWHSDKLRSHFEHFRTNPNLGVSYSASAFVDEAGQSMGIGQNPKTDQVSAQDIFCRNPIGNGSAAVIRRSVLMQTGQGEFKGGDWVMSYFDETMRQSEDVEFWLRIALTTHWTFGGIAKPLTFYRVNANGLSANLDNQFNAWRYAVEKNRVNFPDFYNRWHRLAAAYQKRYLARRAIRSGNGMAALKLINSALWTDPRILRDEPSRTLITYGCALLCLLPNSLYEPMERFAMRVAGRRSRIATQ